jgi:ATP-dependent exoDNAse (exonuclease V) beta subunit
VLHAAPGYVRPALSRTARVNARQVGDMVHEALRYWRLPRGEAGPSARHENDQLFRLLNSIAWELGITDPAQSELAVWRAMTLLFNFKRSPLCAELAAAAEVYRELPFIFERETHIIHGVMDVLYRAPDGGWTLVDYKTSQVIGASGARGRVTVNDLRRHARRYHMQLGVYAEAAQAQLGEPLAAVKVHYIRYATVDIAEADWRAALARGLRATVEATMR